MATTTASLSLTSTDLFDDSLSISTSNALNKAGTTIGLDQTTGLNKVYLTATTNVDIITVPGATKDGKKSHVYIANLSEDETEYMVVSVGDKVIGRLYAGDWMWMPWNQQAAHLSDIEIAPNVATGMWIEYMIIHEGVVLTSSVDS
tara:strand:+ start:130 stop:567 length:438 start_codon:yes stop_codon:yes gene_type:complete